ncbi:hypothetical protein IE81DRAFT_9081 [Ceraceosorus guamensis]|uniref:Uncharacterized protein n=1 Tax=Ceraceosorus guamensis TaxID=1522189 RepID=A0A316W902_9BASI|nr:hypothetical protein IE81DRAFT_9081 [Ceraceosorus guamensis]PWN44513.1 hypothetical protein IE81DRAFT_9081 [Ceraceosorus guamensis]
MNGNRYAQCPDLHTQQTRINKVFFFSFSFFFFFEDCLQSISLIAVGRRHHLAGQLFTDHCYLAASFGHDDVSLEAQRSGQMLKSSPSARLA